MGLSQIYYTWFDFCVSYRRFFYFVFFMWLELISNFESRTRIRSQQNRREIRQRIVRVARRAAREVDNGRFSDRKAELPFFRFDGVPHACMHLVDLLSKAKHKAVAPSPFPGQSSTNVLRVPYRDVRGARGWLGLRTHTCTQMHMWRTKEHTDVSVAVHPYANLKIDQRIISNVHRCRLCGIKQYIFRSCCVSLNTRSAFTFNL